MRTSKLFIISRVIVYLLVVLFTLRAFATKDSTNQSPTDPKAALEKARALIAEAQPILGSYFNLRNQKKRDLREATNKIQEAIAILEKLHDQDAYRYEACLSLGLAYRLGHNLDWENAYEKAEAYLEEAARLQPNNPEPIYQLGSLRSSASPLTGKQAVKDFLRVIEMDPASHADTIYSSLAFAYGISFDIDHGLEACNKQLLIGPKDEFCLKMIPIWQEYIAKGDRPKAIDLSPAIDLDPWGKSGQETRPILQIQSAESVAAAVIEPKGNLAGGQSFHPGYPDSRQHPGQKPTAKEILADRAYYSDYFDYKQLEVGYPSVAKGFIKVGQDQKDFDIEKRIFDKQNLKGFEIILWGPDQNNPDDQGLMAILDPAKGRAIVDGREFAVSHLDAMVRYYYDKKRGTLEEVKITEGPVMLHLKALDQKQSGK